MPGSVVVAVVFLGIAELVGLIGAIVQASSGGSRGLIQLIVTVVIGTCVLIGAIRGRRLAWQYGRVILGIGAFFYTVGGLFAVLAVGATAATGAVSGAAAAGLGFFAFVMVFMAVTLWVVVFSLGTADSREYFGLVCPNCGSNRAGAADFWFRTCRCSKCRHTWDPERTRYEQRRSRTW